MSLFSIAAEHQGLLSVCILLVFTHFNGEKEFQSSGRSSAGLEHLLWEQGVECSNHSAPIFIDKKKWVIGTALTLGLKIGQY